MNKITFQSTEKSLIYDPLFISIKKPRLSIFNNSNFFKYYFVSTTVDRRALLPNQTYFIYHPLSLANFDIPINSKQILSS